MAKGTTIDTSPSVARSNVFLGGGLSGRASSRPSSSGSSSSRECKDGEDGAPGAAATILIGTVETGDPGDPAEVTNSGDVHDAVFNFVIPKGDPGEDGADGADGGTGGTPGANGSVVTEDGQVLTFVDGGLTGELPDFDPHGISDSYKSVQSWSGQNENGTENWTNNAAGDGASIARRSGTPGFENGLTIGTGTQSGGRVATFGSLAGVVFGSGRRYGHSSKVDILDLSDGTDDYVLVHGTSDKSDNPTHDNGICIKYDKAVSANWILVTAKGAARTTHTSSIPVTVGQHKVAFWVNADATSVSYYIDGVLAGTVTTNIPNTAGQHSGSVFGIYKSSGTNDRRVSTAPIARGFFRAA